MRMSHVRKSFAAGAAMFSLVSAVESLGADSAPPAPMPRFQTFRIGSYTGIALNDGALRMPNDGKSFVVGRSPAEVAKVLTSGGAPGEYLEFDVQPLLVRTDRSVLLFDTGAGNYFGPITGELLKSMAAAGMPPAGVTDIFISHAHGDHVGGLVTGTGALAFPNATIHMSAPEWAWLSTMTADEAKKFGMPDVTALVAAIRSKVVPFQPGATLIPDLVTAVEIKGHTPGHSGYQIGSGADSVLYIGDSMHSYVISVRKPSWKVEFDQDQQAGAASRTALVKRVAASGQRVYAVHFPFPGIGKIVEQKGMYVWVPEVFR